MPCRVSLPRLVLIIGSLSASGASLAQSTQLDTMDVTAPRLDRELYDTPAAVSVVERDAIAQGQQGVRLDESLVRVPGMYLQNRDNFAQGTRVAMRGFGSRTQWGVRGITILVDGIPYTLPDGQSQLDAIDLDSAERIEVIRGPSAVQYGNAAGGVINVTTADGRDDPGGSIRVEGGSDGYRKLAVGHGGSQGDWSHHVSATALSLDGYRDQSSTEKYQLNARLRHQLDDDRSLTAIVNLLDNPRSEDPGGLTAEQVAADREQSGRFTEDYDTGQTVDQQVLGLKYRDQAFGPGELTLKGFSTWRDFTQQLPYPGDSRLGYQRHHMGGSAEYQQDTTLGSLPLSYVTGIDLARQEDDRYRRDVSFAGDVGGRVADETQTAESIGVFAQGDLALTDEWTASLGVRFDRVDFDIDDDFTRDGDQSGERTFNEWSGSAGLSYRYLPTHQAYLNTGTSFETPTFSEFANPNRTGGFNPGIEPQKAWNREVGLRGHFDNGIDYDLALFSIRTRDELIAYTLDGPDDRAFYRNAGDTSRDGLELTLGWDFARNWRLHSALTLARYEFDEFATDGGRYGGNRLPGLPERTWVNQLTWENLEGRFATLETQFVGDMVADNANQVSVDDYWLINLRAGDGWDLSADTRLKAHVGIRNLLDEEHFANVRINASNDRYFETAPGRSVYAGLELTF
ncbi:TonB-dependent receptor [Halomonas sabkhae]|uniref:TonB-dependent receptor family protein n=1 Tax=Halomonas sabkhae TaxID=626223 RepID=UPI0025B5871D|nr:TonB-dependent receptor [Halomonas sabkhae]MDN3524484.1 TonB-dependent receptor [Halomonas sabkhae]